MDDLRGGVLTLEHRYEVLEASAEAGLAVRYRGRLDPFGLDVDIHAFDVHTTFGFPQAVADAIAVRLRRAARAASRLRGRHVVRVLDYGELSATVSFWVTDRVSGPRLDQIIRSQGRLPLDGTARVIREVAEALTEAHEQGFGHFAVRPEHVWFEQAPSGTYARLGGFGHTLMRHELTLLDVAQASRPIHVDHFAPETLSDPEGRAWLDSMGLDTPQTFDAQWGDAPVPRAELDPSPTPSSPVSADTFALAVLAYRCLTGAHPYVPDDVEAWRDALEPLAEAELIPPEEHGLELPSAVWRILQSGLARDPGARPPSAVDFARELDAAISSGAPSLSRSSAIRPALSSRSSARRPAIPAPDEGEPSPDGPALWGPDGPPDEEPADPQKTPREVTDDPWTPDDEEALLDHPRVRYLATALVVLVVTNLLTLGLLTGAAGAPPLRLQAEPEGARWHEVSAEGVIGEPEEEAPAALPPDREVRYRLVPPGEAEAPIDLRWLPNSDARILKVTFPQPPPQP